MSAISLDGLDAVATKGDIAELEASLTNRIDELRARTTTWVLGLAVTNIGAVVSVALIVR